MGCLEENAVQAFARGQLRAETLREVEAHARDCAECLELLHAALTMSGLDATGMTVQLGPTPSPRPASRAPLAKGTSIGRYTVLELVGRGGMGEVYSAYDPGLDRRVAVKLLHGQGGAIDPRGQERLLREGQAIAKLSHPNVVVVHDVGTIGDQVFVAMEYVDGWTLASWLTERQRTWPEILGVFIKAGRGLAAAHRAGFVHRDFKPQNVMVGRDGAVRVMDFGLARRIDRDDAKDEAGRAPLDAGARAQTLTQTDVLVGTPYYMAPEQVARGATDARSDQFSFCVALHWALTGTHPFGGTTPSTELTKSAPPAKMPSAAGGTPPWLVRILRRGLSQSPDARWPTMDDLLAVLSRDRSRRRRRAVFAGATLLLVGAMGIATARSSMRGPGFCLGGPGRLGGIWEAPGVAAGSRREKVRAAILQSGITEAAKTWERVATLLDQRAAKWLGTYRDVCEATRIRGEQSEEMLDLKMTCLDENLDSMRALTELIAAGDRAVIEHAVEAAATPEDLTRCDATEAAHLGPRLPKDPLLKARVQEARKRLNEGEALRRVGEYERASAVADEVLGRPDVGRICPVEAEALLLKSLAQSSWDGSEEGLEVTKEALVTGERCGHERVMASALGALVFEYPTDRASEVDLWLALHGAILARLGGDPLLEAWFANDVGSLRARQGRWEEALRELSRSIEMKERASGPDTLDIAISHSNLAEVLTRLRRFDEAIASAKKAIAIEETWTSADTLDLGMACQNLGDALLGKGQVADAELAYKRALSILEVRAPKATSRLQALSGLASIALSRGDVDGAVSEYDSVLRAAREVKAQPELAADTQLKLAVALQRGHHDPSRVRDLAKQALTTFTRLRGFESDREDAQALLDGFRPRKRLALGAQGEPGRITAPH